jgi:Fe-S-cluster containining protein
MVDKEKNLECVEGCGWCCEHMNMPVPTNELFTLKRTLELFLLQGHNVYRDPGDKLWYVIIKSPCAHFDIDTKKCRIYHLKRPYLCREWVCHAPGHMYTYHAKLFREGREYVKNLL